MNGSFSVDGEVYLIGNIADDVKRCWTSLYGYGPRLSTFVCRLWVIGKHVGCTSVSSQSHDIQRMAGCEYRLTTSTQVERDHFVNAQLGCAHLSSILRECEGDWTEWHGKAGCDGDGCSIECRVQCVVIRSVGTESQIRDAHR